MAFDVNIINTGSSGNCTVIDECIMFDLGLPFKKIGEQVLNMSQIFITHEHGDHINFAVLNKLNKVAPWMLANSLYMNVATYVRFMSKYPTIGFILSDEHTLSENDTFEFTAKNGRLYKVDTFKLEHDNVENQGFVITNDEGETLIYATDTNTMKHAPKMRYDYIIVEGNYDEDKVIESLTSEDNSIAYRAAQNLRHLSVQQFETFVVTHAKPTSTIIQLHESAQFGVRSDLVSKLEE